MEQIAKWFAQNLPFIVDYAWIFACAAALLVLILLIVIIVSSIRVARFKKISNNSRNAIETNNKAMTEQRDSFDAQIRELNARIDGDNKFKMETEKQISELVQRVDELTKENGELAKQNEELTKQNEGLASKTRKSEVTSAQAAATVDESQPAAQPKTASKPKAAAKPKGEPKTAPAAKSSAKPKAAPAARKTAKKEAEPVQVKTVEIEDTYADNDEDFDLSGKWDELWEEFSEYADDQGKNLRVVVKYDRMKANWVIRRSDQERVVRRVSKKDEAVIVAKELAKKLHAPLYVHKKDGKFQKV